MKNLSETTWYELKKIAVELYAKAAAGDRGANEKYSAVLSEIRRRAAPIKLKESEYAEFEKSS